jgi:hypothetical protein
LKGRDSETAVEGCVAQARGRGLIWPDPGFLMFSIPEGENKRAAKVEATLLGKPEYNIEKKENHL